MSETDTKTRLLDYAFAMVEEMPLSDLTLRPLADRAGVSVATLNHHFGNKQAVLSALVDASIGKEQAFAQRWLERLDGLSIMSVEERADIASVAFADWTRSNKGALLVLLDLLQSPMLLGTGSRELGIWSKAAGAFWSKVLFGSTGHCEIALGYAIDEAAFALGAQEDPLLGALRRLCLDCFISSVTTGQCDKGRGAQFFDSVIRSLEPLETPRSVAERTQRGRTIVDCAAQMLSSPEAGPVTHRSVASRCNVSPATVVYQCGSTEELIVAGIYALIEKMHASNEGSEAASPTTLADLVRATGLIAVTSARMPALAPHAIDMRRRRGENVKAYALDEAGCPAQLAQNPVFRQVFAICIFGTRRLAYALGGVTDGEAGQYVLKSMGALTDEASVIAAS